MYGVIHVELVAKAINMWITILCARIAIPTAQHAKQQQQPAFLVMEI